MCICISGMGVYVCEYVFLCVYLYLYKFVCIDVFVYIRIWKGWGVLGRFWGKVKSWRCNVRVFKGKIFL